jgi:hypothetical protein
MSTKKQCLGMDEAMPWHDLIPAKELPSRAFPSFPSFPSLETTSYKEISLTTESVCTHISASFDAGACAQTPPSDFDEFWTERWRSEDKAAARKAFAKFAGTAERRAAILTAVRKQKPALLAYDKDKRPYMSTWLNKRRFEDQEEPPELARAAAAAAAAAGQQPQLFDDMRDKAAMDMFIKLTEGKKHGR